jgi:hypothetical protein
MVAVQPMILRRWLSHVVDGMACVFLVMQGASVCIVLHHERGYHRYGTHHIAARSSGKKDSVRVVFMSRSG